MEEENNKTDALEESRKKNRLSMLICIGILAALLIYAFFNPKSIISVSLGDDDLTIQSPDKDSYCVTVMLADIRSVRFTEEFNTGEMVSGMEDGEFLWGQFKNAELGTYSLIINTKVEGFIILETDKGYVVFNMESVPTTSDYALALDELLHTEGYLK